MKRSSDILGLRVLSIEEGKYIGRVKHMVINPQPGRVDFVLVEDQAWYLGLKALAFMDIQGIGESALTVTGRSVLLPVVECDAAVNLLEKDICLNSSRVLSDRGRLVGSARDYFIDENSGEITGFRLSPENDEKPAGIIPRQHIITFGCEFLIIEDQADEKMMPELVKSDVNAECEEKQSPGEIENAPEDSASDLQQADSPTDPADILQGENALKHFEEQQRQYLLDKKATMRIVADNGEVIVERGETITDDIIKHAKDSGKYIELTMNISD